MENLQIWKVEIPNLEGINSKFGNLATSRHPPQICQIYFQMSLKNPTLYNFSANQKLLVQLFQQPHMETFQLFQKVLRSLAEKPCLIIFGHHEIYSKLANIFVKWSLRTTEHQPAHAHSYTTDDVRRHVVIWQPHTTACQLSYSSDAVRCIWRHGRMSASTFCHWSLESIS